MNDNTQETLKVIREILLDQPTDPYVTDLICSVVEHNNKENVIAFTHNDYCAYTDVQRKEMI